MDETQTPITPRAEKILNSENQLYREMLSVSGMAPYPGHDTSPRKQMYAGNLDQFLVVKGATERYHQVGMEREYGKYTFNVKAPGDIEILKVVDRYPPKMGKDSIRHNPQTIIIYEDVNTREVGYLSIENFKTNHPHFGFRYRTGPAYGKIRQGAFIEKGEVFLESPNVTEDGGYKYGLEFNVAAMTMPGISEDGIIASESALKRLRYHTFERRVVEFGPRLIPTNLYGDTEQYRICPDIGENVRDDGLLMALRPYNVETSPYDQSPHGLMEFQNGYDKPFYVPGGGKVVDIIVHHNPRVRQARVPFGMDQQLQKYYESDYAFYKEIRQEYFRLKKLRGEALVLKPSFHALVRYALYITDTNDKNRVVPYHRRARIDDWRVEFVIQYENTPGVGFKLTGAVGDKGTITKVLPDEDMPVDDFGNRAELVVDPLSVVARSILGKVYEPKMNAVFRDICVRIRERLGLGDKPVNEMILKAKDGNGQVMEQFNYLTGFYKIISPEYMYPTYTQNITPDECYEHLANVLNGSRFIFMPAENGPRNDIIVRELNKYYPNNISPVTYRGNSGKLVRTKENILISSAYHLALDKPGEDYAALNSGKLQHYGILARINESNKYSSRIRHQPTRVYGETEMRIIVSYTKPYVAAELMDRNNNRQTMEELSYQLLTAPNPSQIPVIIDRTKIPYGQARPLQIARHVAECYGYQFVYTPYVPTNPKPKA